MKPPGFYKSIFFDVLTVLAAGLTGFSYYRYLEGGSSLVWVVAALALWGVFETMLMFLPGTLRRRSIIMVLEVAALIGFFYRDEVSILLLTGGIVLLFLVWGYLGSRSLLDNSIEIQFFRTTSNTLGKLTTAALLFMVLIYVPQLNPNSVFVSRQSFSKFFDGAIGFMDRWYPSLSSGGSLQSFASGVAKLELQNNPSFQALPPDVQSSTLSQATTQVENNFSSSDAFYDLIVGMLQGWQSQGSPWFIIGWAAVLFLALRTIGIVFVWIVQFIALVFYEILLATGFIKITESTQTKENLIFS